MAAKKKGKKRGFLDAFKEHCELSELAEAHARAAVAALIEGNKRKAKAEERKARSLLARTILLEPPPLGEGGGSLPKTARPHTCFARD